MLERYLRLHLQANLDRPQTVRHFRDALRRLVTWMVAAHPEMTSLADLHREHAEEFLRWLGTQTSQHTGAPLSVSFRRSIITLITRFVTETAAWGWDDVPARVLFSRADIPKITRPLPRFIPDHELASLMAAVDQLPDPHQRAALHRRPVERRPPRRDPPAGRRLPRRLSRRTPPAADPGRQRLRRTHASRCTLRPPTPCGR